MYTETKLHDVFLFQFFNNNKILLYCIEPQFDFFLKFKPNKPHSYTLFAVLLLITRATGITEDSSTWQSKKFKKCNKHKLYSMFYKNIIQILKCLFPS